MKTKKTRSSFLSPPIGKNVNFCVETICVGDDGTVCIIRLNHFNSLFKSTRPQKYDNKKIYPPSRKHTTAS